MPAEATGGRDPHEIVRATVADYYGRKVTDHGATPRGVDWNSAESQRLRFDQLLRLIPADAAGFSVLDFGCGYGALVSELRERFESFSYQGFDLSSAMIDTARDGLGDDPRCRFTTNADELMAADYVVASGVLNVKLHHSVAEWTAYVHDTIGQLATLGRRGFAFNALTSYSDPDRQRDDLFYADPLYWFDHCKRRYARYVALMHDYPLYEFTILATYEPRDGS